MAFDIDTFRVTPGDKIKLDKLDPQDTPHVGPDGREAAEARTLELNGRLEELQELLWAQGKHRVLVVLQAMDAGGKDGTIKHVFEHVNPSGVRVAAFKKPSEDEMGRDYLWRVHQEVPANGELVIFNRSHYEDVLVVRVMDLVPNSTWKKRFGHIRAFEELLVDEGTTVIKFFLHTSKEEQRERLQERLDRPEKNWKFDAGDLVHRERWDDYMEAFTDVLEETSTETAPWFIVPANRKWYRNLVISEVMVAALESLDMTYPAAPADIAEMTIPE